MAALTKLKINIERQAGRDITASAVQFYASIKGKRVYIMGNNGKPVLEACFK